MHDPPRDDEDLDRQADALVLQALRGKPRPVDFAALPDEQTVEQLEVLAVWIHWLVNRYRIDHREVPPCWAQHGELVEELSALRTARQGAYARDAPLNGPSDWHQTLAATRQRLSLAVARTGCRPGEHRLAPLPGWVAETTEWQAGQRQWDSSRVETRKREETIGATRRASGQGLLTPAAAAGA